MCECVGSIAAEDGGQAWSEAHHRWLWIHGLILKGAAVTAVCSVIAVSLTGNASSRDDHRQSTQRQHQQLGADAKQPSPNGANPTPDERVDEGPSDSENGPHTLEDSDEVVTKALGEEVGGGDPTEPHHSEVERSHREADYCDLLADVDLPAVPDRDVTE